MKKKHGGGMPKGARMKVFVCACGKIVRAAHLKPEEDGHYRLKEHLTPKFAKCNLQKRVIQVDHRIFKIKSERDEK